MNFLKIDDGFFYNPNKECKKNSFYVIGTEGFTLYTYLLLKQRGDGFTQVDIRMIKAFVGNDFHGFKDNKTTTKYLKLLHKNNYIQIHNYNDSIKRYRDIDLLNIQVNKDFTTGFKKLPEQLFIDKIQKIGHIGWSLLCLLRLLHNNSFGNSQGTGFSCPSQKYLSELLNRHEKTISDYSTILEKEKLVNIEEQPSILIGYDEDGNPIYEYQPNHYKVGFIINEKNKYYMGE